MVVTLEKGSVGIVETKYFTFADPPNEFKLESGKTIGPITVAYETYGPLSPKKDNVVLIVHALSGDAHVAGKHSPDDKKVGWWDDMVGPGKAFDTTKYHIVCSNCLGGCKGSTGPSSANPATGKPYGMSFPVITMEDMVRVQAALLDHLGIERVLTVVGGSMGGMQALQWAISFPHRVASVISIASTPRLTAQGIAFNAVGRNAIVSDPNWNGGDYYGKAVPAKGLAIARMIGHITYLSDESMHAKFGRELRNADDYQYELEPEFEVESYLNHQGESFVRRFDANSYLYITKAMDYFDLTGKYGSLTNAFKESDARFLVIAYSTDWLYPTYQSKEIVQALMNLNKEVTFCEIQSRHGHDSFLLEVDALTRIIRSFLVEVSHDGQSDE
jgi:homoserine O-acetyltransferase